MRQFNHAVFSITSQLSCLPFPPCEVPQKTQSTCLHHCLKEIRTYFCWVTGDYNTSYCASQTFYTVHKDCLMLRLCYWILADWSWSYPYFVSCQLCKWTDLCCCNLLIMTQSANTMWVWSHLCFSHSAVCLVCSRLFTPHLEAHLKGCTSTTWSWVWCYWPEDASRRRPSVSGLWWLNGLCWSCVGFVLSS